MLRSERVHSSSWTAQAKLAGGFLEHFGEYVGVKMHALTHISFSSTALLDQFANNKVGDRL